MKPQNSAEIIAKNLQKKIMKPENHQKNIQNTKIKRKINHVQL